MKIVNLKDYHNPREFRVVHVLEYPTLFEIRDRHNKKFNDQKYLNKLRAEEILAAALAKTEAPTQDIQPKKKLNKAK